MADVAPWLTGDKVSSKKLSDLVTDTEAAPWLNKEPEVGAVEDTVKSGVSGTAKGGIGLLGMGGDLQGLMSKFDISPWLEAHTPGAEWLKAETAKTTKSGVGKALAEGSGDVPGTYKLPNSKQIQGAVEKVTGPFYEPKTAYGRIAHTTGEVLPGLALGGETLPGLFAKSVAAGTLGEGGERAGEAAKSYLPSYMQPYAEPVGKTIGIVTGAFTPAGARRAITPNPMSDQQLNTVNALRGRDPDFPMTAGQATQSPRLMNLEARSPLGQNMEGRQAEAFTNLAQREAGLPPGPFDVTGVNNVGADLGTLRRGNAITGQNFTDLNRNISQERMRLGGIVGQHNNQTVTDLAREIRQGASNAPAGVLSMPGPRYEYMRDHIQGLIDGAASPQEKMALSRIRDHLDNAFSAGLSPDDAARLQQLETQYANGKVLQNVKPQVGRETITPQEVKQAVSSTWGRPAANQNRGTLVPLAEDASRVMTPHPEISDVPPPWFDLASTGVSGLLHGAVGHAAGAGLPGAAAGATEGGVLGHLLAPSLYKAGSRVAGAAVSNGPAQAYLGNQLWRPGAHTSAEPDLLLRLLMSPAVNSPQQ